MIVSSNAEAFVKRKYPIGIALMSVLGPRKTRVTFDSTVIRARAVLESAFANEAGPAVGTRVRGCCAVLASVTTDTITIAINRKS